MEEQRGPSMEKSMAAAEIEKAIRAPGTRRCGWGPGGAEGVGLQGRGGVAQRETGCERADGGRWAHGGR
jgi:hypothetical protein